MLSNVFKNMITTAGGVAILAGGVAEAIGYPEIGRPLMVAGGGIAAVFAKDGDK